MSGLFLLTSTPGYIESTARADERSLGNLRPKIIHPSALGLPILQENVVTRKLRGARCWSFILTHPLHPRPELQPMPVVLDLCKHVWPWRKRLETF